MSTKATTSTTTTRTENILATLLANQGLLFAKPSLVGRHTYLGRNILAPNSNILEHGDDRGYVPVEWWIGSLVSAGNPVLKPNEGIAQFHIHNESNPVLLTDIVAVAERQVMGNYLHQWPLIKVLDIGGSAVTPVSPEKGGSKHNDTSTRPAEVPPIPAHVHNGYICNGCACGHGKLEAYFFPPLPTNTPAFEATTRLGVKPNTTKETLVRCMRCFGINDTMYDQLNVFPVQPFSGWTIECGVIHAPGPYPTFEVQLPQDDGNLLAWQLGQGLPDAVGRQEELERSMLKSAANEAQLFDEVVNLSLTSDPDFMEQFYHPSLLLDSGGWGRRLQTFFNRFYGEAIEIKAGQRYTLDANDKPCSMVVWSGDGTVNGNVVNAEGVEGLTNMPCREMIVVPRTALEIVAGPDAPLLLLSVYPFLPAVRVRRGIACAGLACVDYVISNCGELTTSTDHVRADHYDKRCGGSVYNTTKALTSLSESRAIRVEALTLIGTDEDGDFLLGAMKERGVGCRYIARTSTHPTQVAFLPVYASGERACIVVPGASNVLDGDSLLGEVGLGCKRLDMVRELLWFHLGYPFELPHLQGDGLVEVCRQLRHQSVNVAVSLDLNGASSSLLKDPWSLIKDALPWVALVHMNWDEACALSKQHLPDHLRDDLGDASSATMAQLTGLASPFIERGVGLVAITLGQYGAFVCVHPDATHVQAQFGVAAVGEKYVEQWCGTNCVVAGVANGSNGGGGGVNTVGAGDSFVAGLLLYLESMAVVHDAPALVVEKQKSLKGMLDFAQECAWTMISTGT